MPKNRRCCCGDRTLKPFANPRHSAKPSGHPVILPASPSTTSAAGRDQTKQARDRQGERACGDQLLVFSAPAEPKISANCIPCRAQSACACSRTCARASCRSALRRPSMCWLTASSSSSDRRSRGALQGFREHRTSFHLLERIQSCQCSFKGRDHVKKVFSRSCSGTWSLFIMCAFSARTCFSSFCVLQPSRARLKLSAHARIADSVIASALQHGIRSGGVLGWHEDRLHPRKSVISSARPIIDFSASV